MLGFVLIAVTLTAIATVTLPLLSHRILAYYADDFFYYLQIAHNLVEHGKSTFDGTTLTNGYHPLWLLVVAAFYLCGGDRGVFFGIAVLTVAATVSTYVMTQKLLVRHSIHPVIASFWAAWAALFALSMDRTGMEVILAVPLLLAFVLLVDSGDYLRSPRGAACAGFLAALVILSRLDTVLLLFLYVTALLVSERRSLLLRRVPWICIGLAPLFLYAISNLWFFGSLGPVSSSAKHLQPEYVFSGKTLESLFYPLGLVAMAFLIPAMLLIAAGAAYALMHRRQPALFWAMLAFTPVYVAVLSLSSDWGLWIWYRYPFIVSSIAGLLLLRDALRGWSWTQYVLAPAAFILCALFCVGLRKPPLNTQILNLAIQLKDFAATHPGIYGMGDAAGTPAVVIGQPIVQLEGLVMDKRFLDNIREKRNLLDVLREYGVHYYVSTNAVSTANGCFDLSEPKVAGPRSPHMRATLCRAPAKTFRSGEYGVWVFDLR
ncbi:MAG TPA: hypothetical protein VGM02_17490 [Acidobacteriaceae bacterium]